MEIGEALDLESSIKKHKETLNNNHTPTPKPPLDVERHQSSQQKRHRQRRLVGVEIIDVQCKNATIKFVRQKLPILVCCIMALNIGMFVVSMYINNCPYNYSTTSSGRECFARFLGRFSFQPLKENPLLGPSSTTLVLLGALDPQKVVHEHQGWRLVTCIWLHAGVAHLFANMLGLLAVGIQLERESGFARVGAIYLPSGFGGSLVSILFSQGQISVGASGSLFGLLGAMLSEIITNWTIYTSKFAAVSTLVVIILINLGLGILPHVDNFAHIGGFIVGFLLGFIILMKPQYDWIYRASFPTSYLEHTRVSKYKSYQYALLVLSSILLIVGFIVVIILVFRGVDANEKCTWCHYLTCVPTSKWTCTDSSNLPTCNSTQVGSDWKLTCASNNKTMLAPISESNSSLQNLCTQLCS